MRKTLFVLALLASALSIPLTAHADTMYQTTFDFPSPPGVRGGITTLDFASTPYFFSHACPPLDCLTVLATNPAESGFYSLIDFTQISPTEMVVGYAPYSLSFPYPPPGAFTNIVIFGSLLPLAGPADAPTVLTGTFDGMLVPDAPIPNIPGTITIEPLTNSTVPEPSSFALMATGILGAITTLRYRRFITS